jgi:hypothetical protein
MLTAVCIYDDVVYIANRSDPQRIEDQAIHGLSEKRIYDYVGFLHEAAGIAVSRMILTEKGDGDIQGERFSWLRL